jgi:hypothetical protein
VNEDIARGLDSLGKVYENVQYKNTFEKSSYLRAANIVRSMHSVSASSALYTDRLVF